jgi:L-asparaginase II
MGTAIAPARSHTYALSMDRSGAFEALPLDLRSPSGPHLVYIRRGERVESVHAAAFCVADAYGRVIDAAGDIEMPVFIRSCAKPFIAAAIVRSGAAERYALSEGEIAIIAGSHSGEPHHIATVRSILDKAKIPEAAFRCGAHPPRDEETAAAMLRAGETCSAIHNNCSGKHAGLLMLSRMLGVDYEGYLEPSHPAQAYVWAAFARTIDAPEGSLEFAIDGCGIGVPAIALRKLAMAYARLATLEGLSAADADAMGVVRDAMRNHPQFVGGTLHFDTALMRLSESSLIAKRGAEAVEGIGSLTLGRGAAIKIIDGAPRALSPAVIALVQRTGMLPDVPEESLAALTPTYVRNAAGNIVGRITVSFPK